MGTRSRRRRRERRLRREAELWEQIRYRELPRAIKDHEEKRQWITRTTRTKDRRQIITKHTMPTRSQHAEAIRRELKLNADLVRYQVCGRNKRARRHYFFKSKGRGGAIEPTMIRRKHNC